MTDLHFTAHGIVAGQGSKRHVGGGRMIESSKKLKPWRQDVIEAALHAVTETPGFEPYIGAVEIECDFFFTRPKAHFRTGVNAGELKANMPTYVAKIPDIDKALRSTLDALTIAGVWRDDAQVVKCSASKRFGPRPGAVITIKPVNP